MVEQLLKHGANPNLLDNIFNRTLIRSAIDSSIWGKSEYDKIELLLLYGADPNAVASSGGSYLQID